MLGVKECFTTNNDTGQTYKVINLFAKKGTNILKKKKLCEVEAGNGERLVVKAKNSGVVSRVLVKVNDIVEDGSEIMEITACAHPALMGNICCDCGMVLEDTDIPRSETVSMLHSVPDLKIAKEEAEKLGKADITNLLSHQKLVLLVDLDQTLIHTTNDNIPPELKDVYHFQLHPTGPWYHTRLRPHTKEFLEKMSKLFELHICTFGVREYAHYIAHFLDSDEKLFGQRILSRNECLDPMSKKANLDSLFPCGDNLVCIIDDRTDVWNYSPNVVQVVPYHFFRHTGDINAPQGLQKRENDDRQGIDFKSFGKEFAKDSTFSDSPEVSDEECDKRSYSTDSDSEKESKGKQDIGGDSVDSDKISDDSAVDVNTDDAEMRDEDGKSESSDIFDVHLPKALKKDVEISTNNKDLTKQSLECDKQRRKAMKEELIKRDDCEVPENERTLYKPKSESCTEVSDNTAVGTNETPVKSSDAIHSKPSDEVESKPSDEVESKPSDEIKGKPSDEVKGKPVDGVKDKPIDGVKNKPIDGVKNKPIDGVKNKPIDGVKNKPIDGVKNKPIDGVKNKPSDEVEGKPMDEVEGKPSDEVERKPGDEVEGKPSDEVERKPGDEIEGKPSDEVERKLGDEVEGKPSDEVERKLGDEVEGKPSDEVERKLGDEVEGKPSDEAEDSKSSESLTAIKEGQKFEKEKISPNHNEESKAEMVDVTDDDDFLLYLEDILGKIHATFFREYAGIQSQSGNKQTNLPDLKRLVPRVRRDVLKGMNLVFSGIIPQQVKLKDSKAYQIATCFGATVSERLIVRAKGDTDRGKNFYTTHLVAANVNTEKVHRARKYKSIKIVTPNWLWTCVERWELVEERLFPLTKEGEKDVQRHPPHHCYCPDLSQYRPPQIEAVPGPSGRTRTPSGNLLDDVNPLLFFSPDDKNSMAVEVDMMLSDDDESNYTGNEDEEESGPERKKPRKMVERDLESTSSSSSGKQSDDEGDAKLPNNVFQQGAGLPSDDSDEGLSDEDDLSRMGADLESLLD